MHTHHKILYFFIAVGLLGLVYIGALYLVGMQGGALPGPSGSVQAPSIPPSPALNYSGTVTARSAASVTIKGVGGQSVSFIIATSTQVVGDKGVAAKPGSLVVGALVSIEIGSMDAQGNKTAKTIHIIPPPPAPPVK